MRATIIIESTKANLLGQKRFYASINGTEANIEQKINEHINKVKASSLGQYVTNFGVIIKDAKGNWVKDYNIK